MTALTWLQAALTAAAGIYVAVELRRASQGGADLRHPGAPAVADQLDDVQRREVTG